MSFLSPATIAAQQALSDKFKIPTFDLSGGISTVPSKSLIGSINVGVGKFGGETLASFTDSLNQSISKVRQTGGSIGSTSFAPPTTGVPGSQQTGATQPDAIGDFDFGGTLNEGLGSTAVFLQNNPTLLIAGLGLLALMVFKR